MSGSDIGSLAARRYSDQSLLPFCDSGFSGFIVSAMVIPLSFDFALSLGQSASASGLFMGIQLIAGLAGTLAGRPLVSETAWSQFFVRRLIITSFFFCSFMSLALGCFYNWTARSSQGDFIWWSGLVILAVTAFVGSLTSVAVQVLWTKTTHPANRTVWTFMSQCCRSGGMSLGPIIFSVVSSAIVSGGDPVSPRSMMAWVQIFALYLSIISLAFVTFMPTQLPPVLPPAPAGSVEEDPRLSGEAQPEELEDPAREAVPLCRTRGQLSWLGSSRPFAKTEVLEDDLSFPGTAVHPRGDRGVDNNDA